MPVEVKIPSVGESITEVTLGQWVKAVGDTVSHDETLIELESEKATFDLPAPVSGKISKLLVESGATANVGDVVAYIEESADAKGSPEAKPAAPAAEKSPAPGTKDGEIRVMPAAARLLAERGMSAGEVPATGPGGRLLKEDVQAVPAASAAKPAAPATKLPVKAPPKPLSRPTGGRTENVVPMSPIRRRIASRLVEAQQNAALLTTFNEVDMSAVMDLRKKYKDVYETRYGIKLGFMSFFVKAVTDALQQVPQVNAEIRGTDIVYRNYCDIGIAVGGGKGLVVPVLRNTETLSFAEIELAIGDFAKRAKDNTLGVADLQGGTFTISNGGVYGSMLSTPIVNAPQSGILGMHNIEDRAVVRDGQVVVRPIMYLALTYDHRIVDGREAVTFLKRVRDVIEDPVRMLLDV